MMAFWGAPLARPTTRPRVRVRAGDAIALFAIERDWKHADCRASPCERASTQGRCWSATSAGRAS